MWRLRDSAGQAIARRQDRTPLYASSGDSRRVAPLASARAGM